jgi:hypothetical protein
MSISDTHESHELVVAEDGSIPADQIAHLGLRPGAHLRVVETERRASLGRLGGSLPDFPEITWKDFARGSKIAKHDLAVP